MTAPLSIAPRTPSLPAGEAHDQPPRHAEQPPADDVALRKGGGPRLRGDDLAPAVLVRLDEELDLRLLLVLACLSEPDSANAFRAACSPANRTTSMFSAASARLPAGRPPGWASL